MRLIVRSLMSLRRDTSVCVMPPNRVPSSTKYESRFFEDPGTPDSLAAHLGLSLPAQAGGAIFRALERGNVEAHIARMDRLPGILQDRVSGDQLDPQTHWHTHHAG